MQSIVMKSVGKGADFCDIRTVEKESNYLEFKDGKLQSVLSGVDRGAGLRAISRGAWGFSSVTDTSKESLRKSMDLALNTSARLSDRISIKAGLAEVESFKKELVWAPKRDSLSLPVEEKLALVKDMHEVAKDVKGVHSVSTAYGDIRETTRIVNSDGTDLRGEITRTFARSTVTAREGDNVISFTHACGGTGGWEVFDEADPVELSESAAESAVRILTAKRPPSGAMPLIADPDLAGVFAHEALGHASEGDYVFSGNSCLEGRIGERIGSELVTVVDNPTVKGGFGSFPFDAEGVLGTEKVLVDRGVLNDFILSRETAYLLNMKPNGGARAESYDFMPLVRMSNTFIKGGESSFEELLEGIKVGVYAKGSRGGQVNPAKGTFQFNAKEAFLIENGEITDPLKDVSFGGSTLEVLKNIDAVGDDFSLGSPGNCGKIQWVPVCDGGPHVRVKEVKIGGGN